MKIVTECCMVKVFLSRYSDSIITENPAVYLHLNINKCLWSIFMLCSSKGSDNCQMVHMFRIFFSHYKKTSTFWFLLQGNFSSRFIPVITYRLPESVFGLNLRILKNVNILFAICSGSSSRRSILCC